MLIIQQYSVQPKVKEIDEDQDDVSLFSDEEEGQEQLKEITVVEGAASSIDAMKSNIHDDKIANPNPKNEKQYEISSDDANFSKQTRVALSSLMVFHFNFVFACYC